MTYFVYKCYYIIFLYHNKHKNNFAHDSAILAMVGTTVVVLTVLNFTIVDILELRGTFFSLYNDEGLSRTQIKGKRYLQVIPFIITLWIIYRYFIVIRAKVSKVDGRSEIYSFDPTKRDKMFFWIFYIILNASVFIGVGIKYLLGHYD